MKIPLTPCIVLLLTTVTSCKKSGQDDEVPKKAIVTTIAGSGTDGYEEGAASTARFSHPSDIVVLTDGVIFVADRSNQRIRKIAAGQVSTFAGNGNEGIKDSIGSEAEFVTPHRIAADAAGNLFTLDANDARVRKITPFTYVSTYAGMETEGHADGPAASSKFRYCNGIVADTKGNVYVADAGNHCIRKITPSGIVSTIAGSVTGQRGFRDGPGASALFDAPYGLAIDRKGNLFVADVLNSRIRKITPAGAVSTLCGTGATGYNDGDANTVQFDYLQDVIADAKGNLFISDGQRIRKVSSKGVVTTIAGSTYGFADGEGIAAKFASPDGLAIDAQGNIYVADYDNNRIRKISFE